MRSLHQALLRAGWRSLASAGRTAPESLAIAERSAGRGFSSLAGRASTQLWRSAAGQTLRSGHHEAGAAAVAAQFQRGVRRFYGFAAEGLLGRSAKPLRRPSVPKGMAGSGLAARGVIWQQLRTKATLAEGHIAGAAEAYGPAAFTVGLSGGQRKQLAAWLSFCAAWVFAMVCIGGATRLTRSGLSMTDWKFTGEHRPQNEEEWEAEFAKYKQSPEFKRLNSRMTVEEFKSIYYWEYGHRMFGRALALVFGLPAAYFGARGMINAALARRLGLVFLMGGTQGLVGWWMVRSGLQDQEDPHWEPKVSPYRLTAHLASAFAIYSVLVWTALGVAVPYPPPVTAGPEAAKAARVLSRAAHPMAALVGVTAISGAFVAGLHAGLCYNTWPDMNGRFIPKDYWQLPGLRNMFENSAAAQFNHRLLAYTTTASALAFWRFGTQIPALHPASRLLLHALAASTVAQLGLGVATILTYVPVSLGTAHQAGALTLFTIMLGLLYSIKPAPGLRPFRMMLHKYSTPAAAAAVLGVGGTVAQMQ